MEGKKKLTIYYDGECRFCSTAAEKVAPEGSDTFDKIAVTEHNLPHGITHEASMRDVHVIDAEGNVFKGAEGVTRILRESRWWWPVGVVGSWPVFKQIAAVVYRFVVTHRYWFGGKR